MISYTREDILSGIPDFDINWKRRDFVEALCSFASSKLQKTLMVSGLRGTGKTVGMYQATIDLDALYLRCEMGEAESAQDYADIIRKTEKSNIILDEYTWIQGREDIHLDRLLDMFAHHGKKIFLTGTESAVLESLRHKDFIHRAECIHVTRFSFDEFKRINMDRLPKRSQDIYDLFLKEGGIFDGYVRRDTNGMADYIENSIISNLNAYIGKGTNLSRPEIASAVYTVLYDAVHDTMNEKIPGTVFTDQAKAELARMGIPDVRTPVSPKTVEAVSSILESIGVVVKVPNIVPREKLVSRYDLSDDFRTYIVNPAITWNLGRVVFGGPERERAMLGKLLEASVLVELSASKLDCDDLYFYDTGNGEVDAVIVPRNGEEEISLFEIKHRYEISSNDIQNKNWTILTGKAERDISERFPDIDSYNRYFVYTGQTGHEIKKGKQGEQDKEYLLVGLDENLRRYWDFDGLKKKILGEVSEHLAEDEKDTALPQSEYPVDMSEIHPSIRGSLHRLILSGYEGLRENFVCDAAWRMRDEGTSVPKPNKNVVKKIIDAYKALPDFRERCKEFGKTSSCKELKKHLARL